MSDGASLGPGVRAEGASAAYSADQTRRCRDVLARLSGARRAQRFYPVGHPAVRGSAAALMHTLGEYHAEGVDVSLTFFEDEVLLGQQRLTDDSILFDQLVRDISASGANSLTFVRGLSAPELERALPLLAADAAGLDAMGGLDAAVRDADAPHVVMAHVTAAERVDSGVPADSREAAQQSYASALEIVRDVNRLLSASLPVPARRVGAAVRGLVDNVLSNRSALLELSGLKDYDEYTFFHSVNVAILSLALGSSLTTDRRFLNSLGVGALMHDLGKMTVDPAVLNKSGTLTSEEWESMRQHPLHGAGLAAAMSGLDRSSTVIILEHHMRFDLEGYPQRRPQRRQHITSRIVAIADAYDAMTSKRPYSNARLQDEAMEVLAMNAGAAFDPVLVRLFLRTLGVYPPRTVVRLSTGEVGVVVRPGETDVLRPVVRVFVDPSGAIVDARDVDLAAATGEDAVSIRACIDPSGLNVDVEDYL